MKQAEYDRIEAAATKVIANRLTQHTTPAPVNEKDTDPVRVYGTPFGPEEPAQ